MEITGESGELPPLETGAWSFGSDEALGEDEDWRFENSGEPASGGEHGFGRTESTRLVFCGFWERERER